MSSIWTIRRSKTDAKLAGVCAGVAAHWGVDPLLVRVGCALLALSGGIGVVLYLAGWLLIPVEGSAKAPVDDLLGSAGRRWPNELWIVVVVLACVLVFAAFSSVSPFSFGPAVVIALIWYFGFYKPKRAAQSRPGTDQNGQPSSLSAAPQPPYSYPTQQFIQHPGPPTPFTEAADAWRRRIEEHRVSAEQAARVVPVGSDEQQHWPLAPTSHAVPVGWSAQPAPTTRSWTPPPPAAATQPTALDEHRAFLAAADPVGLYIEPEVAPLAVVPAGQPGGVSKTRSARRLRLVVLMVLGLTLAGLGVASAVGVVIPLSVYFASALLVIAAGLIAATWFGRARGLLAMGVLVTIALLVSHSVTQVGNLPVSERANLSYTRLADLPATPDSVDTGQLTVDLSKLVVDHDASYTASVDLGNLAVVVPSTAQVVIDYSVDLGSVRAYGSQVRAGSDLTGTIPDPHPIESGQHTLTLHLTVDAGNVEVRR